MEIKAIVLDFDGTVYFQKPVQIYNLLRIILTISVRPRVISEIRIIQKYRKMREKYSDSNLPILSVEDDLAEKENMSVDKIKLLRDYWLIDSQSLAIQIFQRRTLLRKISQLQRKGIAIILWSDYPTAEKSKRLKLRSDLNLCSEDPRIRFAKPSAEGLFFIIESLRLKKNEVILIGDRDNRDGKAAATADIKYYKIGRNANQILDLMLERLVGTR